MIYSKIETFGQLLGSDKMTVNEKRELEKDLFNLCESYRNNHKYAYGHILNDLYKKIGAHKLSIDDAQSLTDRIQVAVKAICKNQSMKLRDLYFGDPENLIETTIEKIDPKSFFWGSKNDLKNLCEQETKDDDLNKDGNEDIENYQLLMKKVARKLGLDIERMSEWSDEELARFWIEVDKAWSSEEEEKITNDK